MPTQSDDEITSWLFLDEEPVPADLAIVFGSADDAEAERRAVRAAELYHASLTPQLLLTGGDPPGRGRSEAERMAVVARRAGVPEAALWLEQQSRTTWDNARLCAELLREKARLEQLRTVLLVSGSWHLRRTRLIVESYFPAGIRWVCCSARGGCDRDNWTSSPEHRRIVETEMWLLGEIFGARGEGW